MFVTGRILLLGVIAFMLSNCTSTQLNNNTLELASTVDNLLARQVLLNLSRYVDDPTTIPTQVVVAAGTVSTTNTLSPSVSGVPLARASTITDTVASAAATTITHTNAITTAAAAATAAATNTATQTWTVDPSTDVYELSRMRALYRFALCRNTSHNCDHILFSEYPLQTTADPTNKLTVRDVNFLVLPRCVICLKANIDAATPDLPILSISQMPNATNSRINPILHRFRIGWLGYDGLVSPLRDPNEMREMGHFGNHDLAIAKSDYSTFSDFTLFIAGTTAAGSSSAASSGGSKVQKIFNIVTPSG
jgi:hypothetical protein